MLWDYVEIVQYCFKAYGLNSYKKRPFRILLVQFVP